jgi:hypothetical protein
MEEQIEIHDINSGHRVSSIPLNSDLRSCIGDEALRPRITKMCIKEEILAISLYMSPQDPGGVFRFPAKEAVYICLFYSLKDPIRLLLKIPRRTTLFSFEGTLDLFDFNSHSVLLCSSGPPISTRIEVWDLSGGGSLTMSGINLKGEVEAVMATNDNTFNLLVRLSSYELYTRIPTNDITFELRQINPLGKLLSRSEILFTPFLRDQNRRWLFVKRQIRMERNLTPTSFSVFWTEKKVGTNQGGIIRIFNVNEPLGQSTYKHLVLYPGKCSSEVLCNFKFHYLILPRTLSNGDFSYIYIPQVARMGKENLPSPREVSIRSSSDNVATEDDIIEITDGDGPQELVSFFEEPKIQNQYERERSRYSIGDDEVVCCRTNRGVSIFKFDSLLLLQK